MMSFKIKSRLIPILTFFLLLFLFLLPYKNVPSSKFVDGHDFSLHMTRIAALEQSIRTGIILPRWLPWANYGFGSPLFTFIWGFPYYVGALLRISNIPFELVNKLLIIIPGVIGGFGVYFWQSSKTNSKLTSAASSIVYAWTPYFLLDRFVRYALGETWFLGLLPLLFWSLEKTKKNPAYLIFTTIFSALLLYTHHGLMLIFMPIILTYIIVSKQNIVSQIGGILLGLGLAAFFWLPALWYYPLLHTSQITSYNFSFPPLWSFIRSQWEGGSVFDGNVLIMSFEIGLVNLGIIILSHIFLGYLIFKKKRQQAYSLLLWLVIFWVSIFLMQPISNQIWINFPLLKQIQLPFRLLSIVMLSATVLSALLLQFLPKNLKAISVMFLVLAILITNRNHLGILNKKVDSQSFYTYQDSYDAQGEVLPLYANLEEVREKKDLPLIGIENGTIETQTKNNNEIKVIIKLEKSSPVYIKQIFFPGWQVVVDENLNNNFVKKTGISIPLDAGAHNIKINYTKPTVIKISEIISGISLLGLLGLCYNFYIKKTSNND